MMTLLASQIPVLYCLMYFQSTRRPSRNHPSLLLNGLAPSRHRWSRSPSSRIDDSRERFGGQRQVDGGLHDSRRSSVHGLGQRSWTWHKEEDPRKLCPTKYFDFSQNRLSFGGRVDRKFLNKDQNKCSARTTHQMKNLRDVMSGRFMTVEELRNLIPEVARTPHRGRSKPARRYKADDATHSDMKVFNDTHCGICNTEIGYEVLTHIQDLKGLNHTVINFQNAYQFIPAGRCINENSPCGGGGGARCIQVYRAQWTLVWAPTSGTRLVAHEVPSHCQCLNVGLPVGARNTKMTMTMNSNNVSLDSLSSSHTESGKKVGTNN